MRIGLSPRRLVRLGAGLFALVAAALASDETEAQEAVGPAMVVFVCQHGNVKSLMAREWFDRLARERGLSLRAVSRGLTPASPVPPPIRERLGRDGFDVARFEPRALAAEDVEQASRLVVIGVDAPAWVGGRGVRVEKWDGIPPASERYEASRDALRARIVALLDQLTGQGRLP